MAKFKVGDICRVIEVDEDDKKLGINVGDRVEVLEEDDIPECKFLNNEFDIDGISSECCEMDEDQLELVEN